MIRIITIALALLAITVLLASSFSVLFSASDSTSDPASDGVAEEISYQSDRDRSGKGRAISRQTSGLGAVGTLSNQLQSSPLVQSALETQVSNQLSGFIEGLALDDNQSTEILNAFAKAYKDAAVLASMKDSLNTQAQDPNFVVNAMAELLEPDQLTDLELYLESSSKQKFMQTVAPQLEIISGSLSAPVKQQLLETYFDQHYAATNPHGSLAPQTSAGFLTAQLEALRTTRTQLENSLPASEFALVDKFLSEQEAGLDLGLGLFESSQ